MTIVAAGAATRAPDIVVMRTLVPHIVTTLQAGERRAAADLRTAGAGLRSID
jgi:hypothetical protein